ncbi:MAG: hypothetical protein K1X78_17825 [Verrucomicrobiaceae bacterium]|nr:hypothetical protein [Verrucomicrobiaceae bacterium]
MNTLSRKRLTRSLLLELPVGTFVISNLINDSRQPVFAAQISDDVARDQLWLQARQARADGRLCWLTRDPSEYERQRQLTEIATHGDEDNAECAATDLAKEFPTRA